MSIDDQPDGNVYELRDPYGLRRKTGESGLEHKNRLNRTISDVETTIKTLKATLENERVEAESLSKGAEKLREKKDATVVNLAGSQELAQNLAETERLAKEKQKRVEVMEQTLRQQERKLEVVMDAFDSLPDGNGRIDSMDA